MGWLRKRFGESNTQLGMGLLLAALYAKFPQHADVITAVGIAAGVGGVVTPSTANQVER